MPRNKSNGDDYLFLGARATRVSVEEYERRLRTGAWINWDIPELDDYLIPMVPGDNVALVARPGHGKTTIMLYMAKRAARLFEGTNKLLVYITWETLVEEFVALYSYNRSGQSLEDIGRGRADMNKLLHSMGEFVTDNVAVVGRSMERDENGKIRVGRMPTIEDVFTALYSLTGEGYEVGLAMFDYLQRIPKLGGGDRSEVVSENANLIKDLGMQFGCPTMMAVQAKRDVDDYSDLKFPRLSDAQWSSNVEQTTDKYLSVTYPKGYMEIGTIVELGGQSYVIDENTLGIWVPKQRWGKAGAIFMMDLDPVASKLALKEAQPEVF